MPRTFPKSLITKARNRKRTRLRLTVRSGLFKESLLSIPLRTLILPVDGKYSEQHRKLLETNLDKLLLRYIVLRDKNTCVISGCRQRNVAPVFYWKDCPALRWNPDVVHCLVKSESDRFHNRDCTVYTDWMLLTYGGSYYTELQGLARKKECAYSIKKLLEITEDLGKKYQKLLIEKRGSE